MNNVINTMNSYDLLFHGHGICGWVHDNSVLTQAISRWSLLQIII
jgi:hypothetical protein